MLKEVLKKWILNHPDDELTIPYLAMGNKSYTLTDLLYEIENETEVGKDIEKSMVGLTIDLLTRGKEKLKESKLDEEELYKRLVPYVGDDFITIPLFEEGDYRPMLQVWQLPKGNSPYDCSENLKKQKQFIEEWFEHEAMKDWDYIIEDEYLREKVSEMKNSYTIKIFQKGDILDENITPDYSILKLMKVAGDLIEELKEFT